jgi:hypothetical protein
VYNASKVGNPIPLLYVGMYTIELHYCIKCDIMVELLGGGI